MNAILDEIEAILAQRKWHASEKRNGNSRFACAIAALATESSGVPPALPAAGLARARPEKAPDR